jgi:hypothetical protein
MIYIIHQLRHLCNNKLYPEWVKLHRKVKSGQDVSNQELQTFIDLTLKYSK